MPIKKQLLKEHSKTNTEKVARYIGNNPQRFHELISIMTGKDDKAAQRASWVVSKVSDRYPELVIPQIPVLLKRLNHPSHDAIKRNAIRAFMLVSIPKRHSGKVYDVCYRFLARPDEAIAVRVFSMTVLVNLAEHHPDLARELQLLIESGMTNSTPGYRSRARRELKRLALLRQSL